MARAEVTYSIDVGRRVVVVHAGRPEAYRADENGDYEVSFRALAGDIEARLHGRLSSPYAAEWAALAVARDECIERGLIDG